MVIMDLIKFPPFPKFMLKPGSPNVTVFGNRPFKEVRKNELSYKGGTLIQLLLRLSYSEEETVEMCLHTQKRS